MKHAMQRAGKILHLHNHASERNNYNYNEEYYKNHGKVNYQQCYIHIS